MQGLGECRVGSSIEWHGDIPSLAWVDRVPSVVTTHATCGVLDFVLNGKVADDVGGLCSRAAEGRARSGHYPMCLDDGGGERGWALPNLACMMPRSLCSLFAVAIWLGMAKAGVCTALINIHIKGPPLVHAIRKALDSSKSQVVVVGTDLLEYVTCPEVLAELPPKVGTSPVCQKVDVAPRGSDVPRDACACLAGWRWAFLRLFHALGVC